MNQSTIAVAEHTSRMGLDDAFSNELAKMLAQTCHPAKALENLQWEIPPHEELKGMDPHERSVVLVPIVSVVVARLTAKLSLNHSIQAELIAEGCRTLSRMDFTHANKIKNYAWKSIYRNISSLLDDLLLPQVIWCEETGVPLNGHYIVGCQISPFRDWQGVEPALRALFDVCQDDIDRGIIKARWANNRCITEGYLTPPEEIAELLGIPEPEVQERLQCLCNRWRCYINKTQRFTKHLPAIPPRIAH